MAICRMKMTRWPLHGKTFWSFPKPDKGTLALKSGLNALITGDMLTTKGISPAEDIKMAHSLGFSTTVNTVLQIN